MLEFFKAIFGLSDHIAALAMLAMFKELHVLAPDSALKRTTKIKEDIRGKLNVWKHTLYQIKRYKL